MKDKIYVKSPKLYTQSGGINPYSSLTRIGAYKLETKCLKSLGKNYICTCGHGSEISHFPKLISRDKDTLKISMTWVGDTVKDLRMKGIPIKVPNMEAQVKCIINNLDRAGVYHLDMHKSGKNLCIRRNTLSVIDFDIAMIKKDSKIKPETPMLVAKLATYKDPSYQEHFYTLVHGILSGKFITQPTPVNVTKSPTIKK